MAYVFTNVLRQNRTIKGNWESKVLKDIKKAVSTKSYQRTNYIGNGVVLTRIAYEALGMREQLNQVPADDELQAELRERRQIAQREARARCAITTTDVEEGEGESRRREKKCEARPIMGLKINLSTHARRERKGRIRTQQLLRRYGAPGVRC